MSWKDDLVYKTLEAMVKNAGVTILYEEVPPDRIDGEIWARANPDTNQIMMPIEEDAFPNVEIACLILGHEMGHILSGLDSPDYPVERRRNEAVCDLIGVYLFRLASMTIEQLGQRYVNGEATEEEIQQYEQYIKMNSEDRF